MADELIKLRRVAERKGPEMAILGDCLRGYSDLLGPSRSRKVQQDSLEILDKLLRSGTQNSSGLVVGRVQSGKTASIVGVIAAARDNGFPIVVVSSGITELLQSQTMDRLNTSFDLENSRGQWLLHGTATRSSSRELVNQLENWDEWKRSGQHAKPPTTIYVPLKNTGLTKTANAISQSLEAIQHDVPVLIIDDESDLASPNNQSRKNLQTGQSLRSPTAQKMHELFECSSMSKFLMYTATPQANLLMEITEQLDPDFCHLLEPGKGYMGFNQYFLSRESQKYFRQIPRGEVALENSKKLPPTGKAKSALAIFLVGCALQLNRGHMKTEDAHQRRSMMMQVSRQKLMHEEFAELVQTLTSKWKKELQEHGSDFEDAYIFEEALTDLLSASDRKIGLEQLVPQILETLRNLRIEILNSRNNEARGSSSQVERIPWKQSPFWILIGSMLIDRGFTVEGLQVTFMPRNPAKNEDTLTQRARFFGYHDSYSEYIRLYMPEHLRSVYVDAGKASDDLMHQLELQGGDLKEWHRNFVANPDSRPTRLSAQGRRMRLASSDWQHPRDLHLVHEGQRLGNIAILRGLLDELSRKRTPANLENYKIYNPKKAAIFEDLELELAEKVLNNLSYPANSLAKVQVSNLIADARRLGKGSVTFVFLDKLDTSRLQGKNLDPAGNMNTNMLMTGASSATTSDGARKYPGDREVFSKTSPTLQLRIFRAKPFYDSPLEDFDFAWWAWRLHDQGNRQQEVR